MSDLQSKCKENQILVRMRPSAALRLNASSKVVLLKVGEILYDLEDKIESVYFPCNGLMLSILCVTEDGNTVEVGVVGVEGASPVDGLLGTKHALRQVNVQLAGYAVKVELDALRAEFRKDILLQDAFLKYVQALLTQVGQTALCNRLHSVEQRMARWLLFCEDRSERSPLTLTHELIGKMLGTRRSTISITAHQWQEDGIIRYSRGRMTVLNRDALNELACACYPLLRQVYEELHSG